MHRQRSLRGTEPLGTTGLVHRTPRPSLHEKGKVMEAQCDLRGFLNYSEPFLPVRIFHDSIKYCAQQCPLLRAVPSSCHNTGHVVRCERAGGRCHLQSPARLCTRASGSIESRSAALPGAAARDQGQRTQEGGRGGSRAGQDFWSCHHPAGTADSPDYTSQRPPARGTTRYRVGGFTGPDVTERRLGYWSVGVD